MTGMTVPSNEYWPAFLLKKTIVFSSLDKMILLISGTLGQLIS